MSFVSFGRTVRQHLRGVITPVVRQASAHKNLSYGTAVMLAVFFIPLAVQAMTSAGQEPQTQTEAQDSSAPDPLSDHSETSVDVSSTSAANQTNVVVNGQHVPVPPSGQVHKKVSGGNGQTSVDVSVHSYSTGNSSSNADIQITHDHSYGQDNAHDARGGDRFSSQR